MYRSWILFVLTLLVATAAVAESFVPRALAPEHGVTVLSRSEAERLVGRQLMSEPASSAVYGEVHLYGRFPFVEARWVHVTSDARWQRLVYGEPGGAPQAFGKGGTAAGEFVEPRGVAFAPDGRLFVVDRALGRLNVLRVELQEAGPKLRYVTHLDGLVQPMDVAVHDGGTPQDASDDRVFVVEAGAHKVSLFAIDDDKPSKLSEFGSRGPAEGEFLYPRAVAVGRRAGANVDDVYVADAGSHRVVRLELRGARLEWRETLELPMEATSIDVDHHGNLLMALRRHDDVWKVSPQLERLAAFSEEAHTLAAPRDVAVPFAWVHDHREAGSTPSWRGQGSAFVLEEWNAKSGVRMIDLGVEIRSLRQTGAGLEVRLTDNAAATLEIQMTSGQRKTQSLGTLPAGTQTIDVQDIEGAARVRLTAASTYDTGHDDEHTLELQAVSARRVELRQNVPNPFNPRTTIRFDLPLAGRAVLDIFDVKGRRIQRVLERTLPAGSHSVVWDGRDAHGRSVSSGVYFYRLKALDTSEVRKMVLAQ